MKRLKIAMELLFQRQANEDEDAVLAWERMSKEIKGSILTLFTLFELVALTSYIPIDSFNLFQGRLDHMNNLGGIVGALLSEWFLGTVGIVGYALVILTAWIAFSAFRGIAFKRMIFKIVGFVLSSILAAISCYLLLRERFPEASLFQGGVVGKTAGSFLIRYFNTTGALLIVGGAFLVTSILTTGLSITKTSRLLFEEEEEESETVFAKNASAGKPARALSVSAATPPNLKPSSKRRRKGARKQSAAMSVSEDGLQAVNENEDPNATQMLEEGTVTTELDSSSDEFTFEEIIPYNGSYQLPTTRLLKSSEGGAKKASKGELMKNAQKLCEHLLSFQITGEVEHISEGPVLTTYEYKPSAGIKLKAIANLQDDLGVVFGTRELRVIAPIPGKTVVGIEVPRKHPETISLKEVLGEAAFFDKKIKIPVALGKATDGTPTFADLTAMPHLLVAGATGSGKSVFINSLIMSFLYRLTPHQLRLILIDPKMLELSVFDGIPHLITNVVTDNKVAFNALSWAVQEMDRRYNLMAQTASKNIDSYNDKISSKTDKLPYIVIVVDELADLMLSGGEEVEIAITRLAQKARAAGIHLVIATQRPSTDVITGLIKANIPSRLSFKVPSGIDSRTVLDSSGAEELIGRGDSLMIRPAVPLQRLHGCFVTEEELLRVVKFVKGNRDHSQFYIDFSKGNSEE